MSRPKKTLLSLTLVAVVATTALIAGPVASASADAFNRSSASLRLPSSPTEKPRCVERTIYLASGAYRWMQFHRWWASNSTQWRTRHTIRLRAGNYRWQDCLVNAEPPRGSGLKRGYEQTSRLYELRTGGRPALVKAYTTADYGPGTYTYGSALLRRGP